MCRVLKVSKSGYYAWVKRQKTTLSLREKNNQELAKQIFEAFVDNYGVYGSPRIHAELVRTGQTVSVKKVANMMREMNLVATAPRAKYDVTKKKENAAFPNLLNRQFAPGEINKAWVADITYIRTIQGWVYLATVMDLGSRKIIGWAIDRKMEESLITKALNRALLVRKPKEEWIHHSDQGSQYTSLAYIELLNKHQASISMSKKGTPADNACIEAFHSTIKREWIYRQKIENFNQAKKLIEDYIISFYNERRRHSSLGYLSPNQYERNLMNTALNSAS